MITLRKAEKKVFVVVGEGKTAKVSQSMRPSHTVKICYCIKSRREENEEEKRNIIRSFNDEKRIVTSTSRCDLKSLSMMIMERIGLCGFFYVFFFTNFLCSFQLIRDSTATQTQDDAQNFAILHDCRIMRIERNLQSRKIEIYDKDIMLKIESLKSVLVTHSTRCKMFFLN